MSIQIRYSSQFDLRTKIMASSVSPSLSFALQLPKSFTTSSLLHSSSSYRTKGRTSRSRRSTSVQGFFNPLEDQPILKDALKEPVVFMGGVFAGLLRLDLNEEPLREWLTKTVEASGMSPEELKEGQKSGGFEGSEEGGPQQIEIE